MELSETFVFLDDQKTKMAALANLSTKVAHCTQVYDMWLFGPLVRKNVLNRPTPVNTRICKLYMSFSLIFCKDSKSIIK